MLTADLTHITGPEPAPIVSSTARPVARPRTASDRLAALLGTAAFGLRGNVLALPPQPRHVAELAAVLEGLGAAELLPLARAALALAAARRDAPGAATANLHSVYAALLACARLLDDAGYPWAAMLPMEATP